MANYLLLPNHPLNQPFVSEAFFSTVLSNLSTPAIKLLPTSFRVSSNFFDVSDAYTDSLPSALLAESLRCVAYQFVSRGVR